MIMKTLQVTLMGCLLALPVAATIAANTSKNDNTNMAATNYTISDALKELENANYRYIKDIHQANPGVYKVEAVNAEGKVIDFVIDLPNPSKTTMPAEHPKKDVKFLTASEIAKKVTDAGYTGITKIACEHEYYKVTALKEDGSKVRLNVNAFTGEIKKALF